MAYTSIKVTPHHKNSSQAIIIAVGLFIACSIGVIAGIVISRSFHLPFPQKIEGMLGLVFAPQNDNSPILPSSPVDELEKVNNESISPNTISQIALESDVSTENIETEANTGTPLSKEERSRINGERALRMQIAISRTTKEMELEKNSAVSIARDFKNNCGVWNDPCAYGYRSALNQSNARYEELTLTLAEQREELELLQTEIADLTSE